MNIAAFSPRKIQLLNQSSPRGSARKRSLFPSNSPQSNDLGHISEIYNSDSDTYSPAPASPSLSITPNKNDFALRSPLRVSTRLNFNDISPLKAPSNNSPKKKVSGKENMDRNMSSAKKSPRKSGRKALLEQQNFNDKFITLISESSEKEDPFGIQNSYNLTTPKKSTSLSNNNVVRRSPRSASKTKETIKPVSFYGNIAPILANNQANRIGGIKCVFRPDSHQSRAKTKLNFEEGKHSKKRERSQSRPIDAMREAKRRKAIFTGVHHAIPKPFKHSSPPTEKKQVSIREKARIVTDLSRTPYGIKKDKKKEEVWDSTLRFTKPLRYEESPYLGGKRKFFKTTVRESPDQFKLRLSPGSSGSEASPIVPKKRRLLDSRETFLDVHSPAKPINPLDIQELIEDNNDKLQEKPEVEDILLRLEEEDEEEEKKKEQLKTREILMNILEDSPVKSAAIDSLSDCTASLDLNGSQSGQWCSRFSLEDENTKDSPRMNFSIFSQKSNGGSTGKHKWRGVGDGQLQIDAGQKRFGHQQCRVCGMIYQAGEAEDEMQHEAFHNNLSTFKHMGWKNENVVGVYGMEHIIVVTSDDPRTWQQKALDVLTMVDKQLGITFDHPSVMHNQKVFLYIADKMVVGCMVATPVSRAYRMISTELDLDICSEESYPVRCGISRMWTLYNHRRHGVASRLLDTVRRNFMYGYILSEDDVAFSIPTPDGKKFCAKYMKSPNFLVYAGY